MNKCGTDWYKTDNTCEHRTKTWPTKCPRFPHTMAFKVCWEAASLLTIYMTFVLGLRQKPEEITFQSSEPLLSFTLLLICIAAGFDSPWWGMQQPEWHYENDLLCSGCRRWCPDRGVSEQTQRLAGCVPDWELLSDPLCSAWSARHLLLATPTKPRGQLELK